MAAVDVSQVSVHVSVDGSPVTLVCAWECVCVSVSVPVCVSASVCSIGIVPPLTLPIPFLSCPLLVLVFVVELILMSPLTLVLFV